MWSYLGRRLIQVPLVLLVVSLMTFAITRATPILKEMQLRASAVDSIY